MLRIALPLVALSAAFWVAVAGYARDRPRREVPRLVAGLVLGAGFAHLAWLALHPGFALRFPPAELAPWRGFTVLAVPLGVVLVAPRAPGARRGVFLAAGLRSLVPALAVARLGCLAADCCVGAPIGVASFRVVRHPVAIYEIVALALLRAGLCRAPERVVVPAFCVAFGAIRLALEPLRAAPPVGPPLLDASWLAAAWLVCGLGLAARRGRSRPTQ